MDAYNSIHFDFVKEKKMKNKLLICSLGTALILSGCGSSKEKVKEIELGDSIDINKMILKDFNDSFEITMQDDALWEYINSDKEKYIPTGEYEVSVKNKDKKVKYIIKVKDTIKPEFETFTKTVYVSKNEKNIRWDDFYTGSDLTKVKLKVDDSKVNYEKEGTYPIKVTLKDVSGNKAQKKAEVVVGDKRESSKEVVNGATYVDGILIVNKKHPIPSDFASGEDPEAGQKIRELIADMQSNGYNIASNYSGYRSHAYQTNLYNNYVQQSGKEAADTYSARPGYSEHETGLCFDLIDGNGALVESAPEAKWIKENAHKYGFILRYPEGKEDITGYMHEPWHLRYVGKSVAKKIYENNLTLEEYLNVSGGKIYN